MLPLGKFADGKAASGECHFLFMFCPPGPTGVKSREHKHKQEMFLIQRRIWSQVRVGYVDIFPQIM